MKKITLLLVLAVFVAGLVLIASDEGFAAWGRQKTEEKEVTAEAVKTVQPVAEVEGEIIYTFKNDEAMTEFEQLYVAKQATYGRMGVLQAYFAMEQNNLTAIDKQMDEKFGFKIDPTKTYDLDRDTREIKETGMIAPPAME